MATEGGLRRTKSLKALLSRKQSRSRMAEDEEPLPARPVKQSFVQYHITRDDIAVQPSLREHTPRPPMPHRTTSQSQRNTWPTSAQESRAGSFALEIVPTLVRTPWELERSSRRPQSQRLPLPHHKQLPRRVFEQLPREIYRCILVKLEESHVTARTVDAASRQADIRNLLFVNKRWHRVAREHLYREVWLPGNEECQRRTLPFSRSRTQLKLLLRTLTESPGLASLVRKLHVTSELAVTLDTSEHSASARRAAYEVLIQIITQCSNLEALSGYSPVVCGDTGIKLAMSLAQCPNLKSYAWNVRTAQLGSAWLRRFDPDDLISCHDKWHSLETLVVCSSPDLYLGEGIISEISERLPSLKHLMLSRLSRHDFNNSWLESLPALKSLRLEHLEGLTDQGIELLAYSGLASSLESLSLVGLELTSLRLAQTLLCRMQRLRRFTFVQDTAPEFRPGIESTNVIRGLQSQTLQYLHWDVLVSGSATTLIANSIASGRFPALRKVKVPCDNDGAIQALCRPVERQPLNAGDLELLNRFESGRYERFLRLAQIQAQLRVHQSRQQPSFSVVVQDEEEDVQLTHVIGSYLGSMNSNIEYSLEPDIDGSFSALAEFGDVEAPRWIYERKNEMERSVQGEQLLDLSALF